MKLQGKKSHMDKVHFAWVKLQIAVNAVYDSELDKMSTDKQSGIRQVSGFMFQSKYIHYIVKS